MRISTSQIFDAGSASIQKSQSALYKLQNQLSTGRRILTPQDDPVASAQALITTQAMGVNAQHITNQGQAKSQLGLADSQLSSLVNALQNVRERVIQAGNTSTLSQSDRETIATELESRLSEMLGIANSDNGSGEYLFSGYKGNVRPFAVDGAGAAIPPAKTPPVVYSGDDGERVLQVSSSRQMAVSVAGSDLFMTAKKGNGTFVTATGGNGVGVNTGTATVDAGSVVDPGKWNDAGNPGKFMVEFTVTTLASGVTSTTYQLYDNTTPATPIPLLTTPQPYTAGQSIKLQKTTAPVADYGGQILVQGQPGNGDTLTIAPSTNQSVFQTMQNLIGILRSPIGTTTYTNIQFVNELGSELKNVDQYLDNVSRVQANLGTRMQEIDALSSTSSDLDIQYQATLSGLQNLDYAKAISDFMNQQMNLEAAQKSFAQVSGMSLFDYL